MAYSAALGAVYNHYLTTYAGKGSVSRYDTHKKSELRSIYNSIVKLNKDAPLYILDSSNESRAFAVGLKENARQLHNTIASLGGLEDEKLFSKKQLIPVTRIWSALLLLARFQMTARRLPLILRSPLSLPAR